MGPGRTDINTGQVLGEEAGKQGSDAAVAPPFIPVPTQCMILACPLQEARPCSLVAGEVRGIQGSGQGGGGQEGA